MIKNYIHYIYIYMIYISLGWNCSPAIIRKNIFKHSKDNGYKTCPFDLCVTPYKSLIRCLETNFENFFNLRIENGIIMNEYDIWFNHEAPMELYANNDYEKFKQRYIIRINNFKEYLCGKNEICFIHSDPFNSSEEIDRIINKNYPNLIYKILSLHNLDIETYKNHFSKNSDCKTHCSMKNYIIFENIKYINVNNIYNCNINENIDLFLEKFIDYNIYANKFGKYYFPKGLEKGIDRIVKNGFIHEKNTLNFIKNNITSNTSIITAGTHIGTFLPLFSKIAKKVYGFEPILENYHYAKLNIELNLLNNINLYNFALGDKECELYIIEHNLIEKSLCRVVNNYDINCTKIKSKKLDSINEILNCEISIIQLDVEGFENKVLSGAQKIIEKFNPILILENNNKSYDIPEFLKKYNYILHDVKIDANIILYIKNKHKLIFY